MRGDDRAVSEVLGFVLVFGIVIASVGLLTVVGFQTMTEYQEGEQLRNAERAMVAIADNFDDVLQSDGIDERSGELALREGTITTGSGGTTLNVTVLDSGDELVFGENVSLGTFEYALGSRDDTIAYEGGGVFRGDASGNVAISDPSIVCNRAGSEAAVVSLIAIDADNRSLSSSNVQEFTAVERGYVAQETYTDVGNVTLTFVEESSYRAAWNDSLTTNGWHTNDGETFTCGDEQDVDRVSVHIVVIDIEY